MLSQSTRNVNTPIQLDSLFDGDARLVDRAERLAMTAAEMIRAAENRWHREYMLDLVHQGGYNRVEVVMPYADPNGSPWTHLLPVGWRQTTSGSWMRTYLIRAQKPNFGSPDWIESERMHEHVQDANAAEWLAEYQQYIAENGIGDPDNLEDMS